MSYDVAASVVLYNTDPAEVRKSIECFSRVRLAKHLWIIDNSPRPVEFGPWDRTSVTYVPAGRNLGYGSAHNIAIRAARARARFSLVMNTDISYEPQVVERLVAYLDANPDVALAAPRINYPDGSLQHVCRLLPTPLNLMFRRFFPRSEWARKLDHDYELRWWDHASLANLPYFQGSFLLMRTELANELGGFDERFFMYGEDIDMTRRLHARGRTMYVPDVSITHEYRRYSSRSMRGTLIGITNNARYFNKWGWLFDRDRSAINRRARAHLEGLRRG